MDSNIWKNLSGLSTKENKVLRALLNQTEAISSNYLAGVVDLSIFQVRYSLKKINAILSPLDIKVIQKPNEGVLIAADDKQKSRIISELQKLSKKEMALNSHERTRLILQMLLTSGDYVQLIKIKERLDISPTSFYRDLKAAKSWLQNRKLSVVTNNDRNVIIVGPEIAIRNVIQEILFENLGENFILQSCIFPFDEIRLQDFEKRVYRENIRPYMKSLHLRECERQIRKIEEQLACVFLDRVHIELCLFLAITVARLKKDHIISQNVGVINKNSVQYHQYGLELFRSLNINYASPLMEYEYKYFSHLLAISFENGLYSTANTPGALNKKQTHKFSELIVQEAAKYFHAGLYGDNDLISCIEWELSHHAKPKTSPLVGIRGSDSDLSCTDPLSGLILKVIKPILIETKFSGPDLPGIIANHIRIALEKARTSFMKRKVLLVCGAGMATAHSLKSQIDTLFPEIAIISITSAFELAHNNDGYKDIDAIITTVPLGALTRSPQIMVNAFLTETDKENIRCVLELTGGSLDQSSENKDLYLSFFSDILTCKAIRCKVDATSPHDLIELTGQLLLDKNAIWPSYIKAMKDLYSLYGSYMVVAPNTAFFHAGPEMGARSLSASLVTVKDSVSFDHPAHGPVMIAIAFASPYHANHTRILSDVFSFFMQEANRKRILAAQTPQEVYKYLQANFRRESLIPN